MKTVASFGPITLGQFRGSLCLMFLPPSPNVLEERVAGAATTAVDACASEGANGEQTWRTRSPDGIA